MALNSQARFEKGVVVVTLFRCRTLRHMITIWRLHRRIKPQVRSQAPGFLGAHLFVAWASREMRSVSLWAPDADLYAMGEVAEHVKASRLPARAGITTSSAVFDYAGDWRSVLFDVADTKPSPLMPRDG